MAFFPDVHTHLKLIKTIKIIKSINKKWRR